MKNIFSSRIVRLTVEVEEICKMKNRAVALSICQKVIGLILKQRQIRTFSFLLNP